jgi:hypothetical protein
MIHARVSAGFPVGLGVLLFVIVVASGIPADRFDLAQTVK